MTVVRKVETIPTLGAGNCGPNAFNKKFWEEKILQMIEENLKKNANAAFAELIEIAAQHFALEKDWAVIKAHILEIRRKSEDNFQIQLAPVMRKLSIALIKKEDKEHNFRNRDRTIPLLVSAFRDYAVSQMNIKVTGLRDDVYRHHDFIEKKKFPELYKMVAESAAKQSGEIDLQEYATLKSKKRTKVENIKFNQLEKELDDLIAPAQKELVDWWEKKDGYATFLNEREQDGVWIDDMQMRPFGPYFGVSIQVYQNESVEPYSIYSESGVIPLLNTESTEFLKKDKNIQKLEIRGIIDVVTEENEKNANLILLPLTNDEVTQRLGAIPDSKKVLDFLAQKEKESVALRTVVVPNDWTIECKEALLQRDVIGTTAKTTLEKEGAYKFSDLTYTEARERIQEIQNKDKIIETRKTYYKESPVIPLINTNAIHWSAAEVTVEPVVKVESTISATKEGQFGWDVLPHYYEDLNVTNAPVFHPLPPELYVEEKPHQVAVIEDLGNEMEELVPYARPTETLLVTKKIQQDLDREVAEQFDERIIFTETALYKETIQYLVESETSKEEQSKKWEDLVATINEEEEKLKVAEIQLQEENQKLMEAVVEEEQKLVELDEVKPGARLISYSISKTNPELTKEVAESTQIVYDKTLAEEFQLEEYGFFKKRQEQEEQDRLFAEHLAKQFQEDSKYKI